MDSPGVLLRHSVIAQLQCRYRRVDGWEPDPAAIFGRINEFIKGKIAKGWRGVGGLVVQVHLVGGRQHAALCGVRLRFEQLDTDATRHRAH